MFDLTVEELACLQILLTKLDRNRHFAPAIGVDLSSVFDLREQVKQLHKHILENQEK